MPSPGFSNPNSVLGLPANPANGPSSIVSLDEDLQNAADMDTFTAMRMFTQIVLLFATISYMRSEGEVYYAPWALCVTPLGIHLVRQLTVEKRVLHRTGYAVCKLSLLAVFVYAVSVWALHLIGSDNETLYLALVFLAVITAN